MYNTHFKNNKLNKSTTPLFLLSHNLLSDATLCKKTYEKNMAKKNVCIKCTSVTVCIQFILISSFFSLRRWWANHSLS